MYKKIIKKLEKALSTWFFLHPRCNTANWTTESGFSGDLLVLSPGHHTSHANDMFTSLPNLLPGRGEIQKLMRKFFPESRLEIPQTCYFCFIVRHSDFMRWFEGLFQPGSSYFTWQLQFIPSDNLQANHIFLYCSLAGLPSKYSTPDLLYLGTLQWWLWSWDVLGVFMLFYLQFFSGALILFDDCPCSCFTWACFRE